MSSANQTQQENQFINNRANEREKNHTKEDEKKKKRIKHHITHLRFSRLNEINKKKIN